MASEPEQRARTAVILSGGGAAGAYGIGVLKALLSGATPVTEYQPMAAPDIFVGTSVGAFNCAYLVSKWQEHGAEAMAHLEQFWLEDIAGPAHKNGVYRIRVNPLELLDPGKVLDGSLFRNLLFDAGSILAEGAERGLQFARGRDKPLERRFVELFDLTTFISTEPFKKTLAKLDYDAIRSSPQWLKVAATNWSTGELRMFWNHDFSDEFGPIALNSSAAIPGLFPPVHSGAHLLADGSVLLNTPLSPAIHAGAEVLHVIYLDPRIEMIPVPNLSNTFDTLFRTQQISWGSAYETDIAAASRINAALGAMSRIEAGLKATPADLRKLSGEDLTLLQERYRPLTIYRYRPALPLGGGLELLDFARDNLEALIDRGFRDAVYHDFREAGDVFPDGVGIPRNPRDLKSQNIRDL